LTNENIELIPQPNKIIAFIPQPKKALLGSVPELIETTGTIKNTSAKRRLFCAWAPILFYSKGTFTR
jgi:hypothetical protein